jgi:hypothetical protein
MLQETFITENESCRGSRGMYSWLTTKWTQMEWHGILVFDNGIARWWRKTRIDETIINMMIVIVIVKFLRVVVVVIVVSLLLLLLLQLLLLQDQGLSLTLIFGTKV